MGTLSRSLPLVLVQMWAKLALYLYWLKSIDKNQHLYDIPFKYSRWSYPWTSDGTKLHSYKCFWSQWQLMGYWEYHTMSIVGATILVSSHPCKITAIIWRSNVHTVRWHYNVPNFLTNIHKKHTIARTLAQGMGCLLWILGAVSIRKTVLPGMAIPMLKIRRPNGRLIFNMEIAIRR